MTKQLREHYKAIERKQYKMMNKLLKLYFYNKEQLSKDLIYNYDELKANNRLIVDLLKDLGFRILKHGFGFKDIVIMERKEFANKYPDRYTTDKDGKYPNLAPCKFIVYDNDYVTAIDNTYQDAWTEDFDMLSKAVKYLED